MDFSSDASDGLHKKRPAKSLRRACWESKSKKRKVCVTSRTDISSPASPDSFGSDGTGDGTTRSSHISDRLGKLEELFEKFVCRRSSTIAGSTATSQSPGFTVSSQSVVESKSNPLESSSDAQSSSSAGDPIGGIPSWTSAPVKRPLLYKQDSGHSSNGDHLHRSLAALLPSQHDADIIFESSNGWMILNGIYRASRDIYVNRDQQSYALNMQAVARERPIIVARTLLHLAICVNSLPPEFDASRLSSMWSLDTTMHMYVETVTSLITSSDEQVMTLNGLETLLLLALYHMNNASLRQSWLVVRRGLNLAHLMGFQRIITQDALDPPVLAVSDAQVIWRVFVDLDRYLGLHLRLPFGAEEYPLTPNADEHLIHRAKINAISREVADLDRDISPQAYSLALALDERLESSMKEMPQEFWEVPNIPPTARSPESYATLERLMVQMWHFETKIFIHLPYLLRASQDNRYEFSKVTALQASRNVLMRWFALRNASITQACYRLAEISVFIAAVTLTLDIVIELGTKEKNEVKKTKGTDFAMICRLIGEMEKLANASPREKIAARSAVVLKRILSSLDPSKQHNGKSRHTIPFFGTVELESKKPPMRPAFAVDSDVGKLLNAAAAGEHPPVFTFINNALWPCTEGNPNTSLDWDIVLFDGLEDRDMEGNWVF